MSGFQFDWIRVYQTRFYVALSVRKVKLQNPNQKTSCTVILLSILSFLSSNLTYKYPLLWFN